MTDHTDLIARLKALYPSESHAPTVYEAIAALSASPVTVTEWEYVEHPPILEDHTTGSSLPPEQTPAAQSSQENCLERRMSAVLPRLPLIRPDWLPKR